jgi:glutaredoxin
MSRLLLAVLLFAVAAAHAQQLYRWKDEKGRVHITDTPPPGSAKDVQKKAAVTGGADPGQMPFELAVAMKEFPVVLYTAPNCKDPCDAARQLLNRRGVPFREVPVTSPKASEELQTVSGGAEVPTILVGRSVQRGFAQELYDTLLDAARYPKAGLLPPRAQAAPAAPAEPASNAAAKPAAEETAAPRGPYAPGAPSQRATQRPTQQK